jgi:chromosome transmission fidelity protein 18
VNANIVKPAEKAVLDRLVELMIPHGLSFWAEKAENGQPMMRLEPYVRCHEWIDVSERNRNQLTV